MITTLKEVVEKPAYIPVTLKASTETLEANLGHVSNPRTHVNSAITIAPFYKEAVVR